MQADESRHAGDGLMLKVTGSLRLLERRSRTGWMSPTAPSAPLRQRWTRLVAAGLRIGVADPRKNSGLRVRVQCRVQRVGVGWCL